MTRILSVACCWTLSCVGVLQGWQSVALGQVAAAKEGVSAKLRLATDSIPAPPQQAAAWKAPPTKLSQEFTSATAVLFQQGLADPRGCEYREIEVLVGGSEPPWTDTVVKTHGWIVPHDAQHQQRFGVCWNGLVYPLVYVGEPADLQADVLAASKADLAPLQGFTGWYFRQTFEAACLCHPAEARSVSQDPPLPIKACLLLRLGEAKLAEEVWSRWTSRLDRHSADNQENRRVPDGAEEGNPYLQNPYLVLANCWTLALFDRGVAAHMRGDDNLALVSAETLATVWPAAEAEAAKRGFPRPSSEKIAQGAPHFLLDVHQASELLANQRRRAQDRRQGKALPVLSGDHPDRETFALALAKEVRRRPEQARRIDLLIRELEEESLGSCVESPVGDPCSFGGGNTIVAFLAHEGEESVEPLLACLESDTRLTHFQSREERYPLPVYLFAEMALEKVLKMPFQDSDFGNAQTKVDESTRRQVKAKKIREYWTRYKGLPMAERWYRILADDRAAPEHWLAAARAILLPESVPVNLRTVAWRRNEVPWQDNGKQKIHGEPLRNKTQPSVAELLAQRIEALNAPYYELLARHARFAELGQKLEMLEQQLDKLREQQDTLSEQRYEEAEQRKVALQSEYDQLLEQLDKPDVSSSACEMALFLAHWDPAAALPPLRRLTTICRATGNGSIVPIILARAAAGDLAGLNDYAAWVHNAKPDDRGSGMARMFEPLCRYPDHPAMVETAEWLFSDNKSPWYPIFLHSRWGKYPSLDLISGPLTAVPAFRKRVLQLLDDRQQLGLVAVTTQEDSLARGPALLPEAAMVRDDPLCPPPGTKIAFRVCDACAYGLSPLEGTPKCAVFWPERNRDQAVTACAAFLRQYGHRFRLDDKIVSADGQPLLPGYWDYYQVSLHLTFPLLNRPATPDEVRRGEAIFSLAGEGVTRVSKLPTLPRNARWTAAKGRPLGQEGLVWQADEVEVRGQSQRYYGFVSRDGLARVPAEEIELAAEFRDVEEWAAFDHGLFVGLEAAPNFERRVSVRKAEDSDWFPPLWFYLAGEPIIFQIGACNRSGADQPLPLLAEAERGKVPNDTIRMSLQLRHCPEVPVIAYVPAEPDAMSLSSLVGMTWTPVPRKTNALVTANHIGRKLRPTERVDCMQLDLNRLFDVSRPGTYRLSLKLASGEHGAWPENEVVFAVTEKSP